MIIDRYIENFFEKTGLSQDIKDFREKIRNIMIDSGKIPSLNKPTTELKREIKQSREDAMASWQTEIGIALSVATLFLGYQLSCLLTILGILLTVFSLIRSTSVGVLSYKRPESRYTSRDLTFMLAWNRGVAKNPVTPYLMPLLMGIMRLHPRGFDAGMYIIHQEAQHNENLSPTDFLPPYN
ncbi:hypothetical protein Huta_1938 [Halorhabdus utahensis DSM 12940]|uniref:Uncharacterized protein n=1 Tax=Halorhabdus utahensis (strain DSM 12940 / JCM 11049 / AX-2) TaxID=519442 RepID=C7NT32_HALUD|nr:hypothetical protein Huta_1938 [Halorhabdus utahensis DSM 12940]